MDSEALDHLLRWVQDGVVSRRQLIEFGATDADIKRMLRRKDLVRVHRGVFINHTGQLRWSQRAWAAVLAFEPAALCFHSAMPGGSRSGPIHVAVEATRMTPKRSGVVVHRMTDLTKRVNWRGSPPTLAPAHATLDVAAAAPDEAAAFTTLATALQTREVWIESLIEALESRTRTRRRRLLKALISDLSTGQNSVLERGFGALARAHGLPEPARQVRSRTSGRTAYRDVVYEIAGMVVELDGRAFHDTAQARDRDAARDLDAASDGLQTLRLTYGQVFRDGCRTASRLAIVLRLSGWTGTLTPCPKCR